MKSHVTNRNASEKIKTLQKFNGLLLRRGNKERTLTYVASLFKQLKQGIKGFPTTGNYIFSTFAEKTPLDILCKCLHDLKPAFLLRPIIAAGKRYQLPVPISDNHAKFMAIDWLRRAAWKNNKNDFTVSELLTREIGASLYREGSARESLRAYIDIALDQRPFGRFIRKLRKNISKSRHTRAGNKLYKLYRISKRKKRAMRYHGNKLMRKINKHQTRHSLIRYHQKRKEEKSRKKLKKKSLYKQKSNKKRYNK